MALQVELLMTMRVGHLSALGERKATTTTFKSRLRDYVHPDDQTQPTIEITPGLKPFTEQQLYLSLSVIGGNNKLLT